MSEYFNQARQALIELENAISRRKKTRETLCSYLPFQEECNEDQWDQLSARCWIYATPHPEEYLEQIGNIPWSSPHLCSQLEASIALEHWIEHLSEIGDYFEFSPHALPNPDEQESLGRYIVRLEEMSTAGHLASKSDYRALHSFLHFLRQKYPDEKIAFLEQILPAKHSIYHGVIKRLITNQERPLSVEIAGAILKALVQRSIQGRPNARHNFAEALALCWMCLSIAKLRLPARLEDLHATPILSLKKQERMLELPTLFGRQPIELTEHFYHYISAICGLSRGSQTATILKGQLSALRRSFADVVQEVDPTGKLGKITFLSFLAPPHYAGRWRR